ncbi:MULTISPECIES: hypothetical protein [unclassified Chryseobacterium]|uniref:hypothetical protein n=2 Tax=Chryseobacterium TaxID=59732 RepID=UPI00226A257D|nr:MULTISPECIES: hypothetical protein [unclassified Chryseobacterium]
MIPMFYKKVISVILLILFVTCSKKTSPLKDGNNQLSELKSFLMHNKGYPIDSFRINLTNDNVPDYLFFDEMDYNSPIFFFDGKTEKSIINEKNITSRFFSFDSIYVKCNKKEIGLLIKDSNGGSVGENRYCKILKFNPLKNSIKTIFEYPSLVRKGENIKEVNYIQVSKSKENCVETITIFKGELLGSIEDENLNIRPINKIPLKIFTYNPQEGIFEQMK